MEEARNTTVVQDAYAAFGRGDIQTLLSTLADDIVWMPVYGAGSHVPTAGERRGKAAVAEFFKQVAETTDFVSFEPKEFVAQGDKVVALGSYSAKMKPSGQNYSSDWVMLFTVRNGKVTAFREFSDSAQLVRAYKGEAATVY